MCGIVGYMGYRDAFPILINGLKRLEYRGYDSARLALMSPDKEVNVYKAKGNVSELERYCMEKNINGSMGIAHTRIQLVKARGGRIIAIITEGDKAIADITDEVLEIPEVPDCLSPIIASIPIQLLAYHIAVQKGCNVDMPHNLAKSVTVE